MSPCSWRSSVSASTWLVVQAVGFGALVEGRQRNRHVEVDAPGRVELPQEQRVGRGRPFGDPHGADPLVPDDKGISGLVDDVRGEHPCSIPLDSALDPVVTRDPPSATPVPGRDVCRFCWAHTLCIEAVDALYGVLDPGTALGQLGLQAVGRFRIVIVAKQREAVPRSRVSLDLGRGGADHGVVAPLVGTPLTGILVARPLRHVLQIGPCRRREIDVVAARSLGERGHGSLEVGRARRRVELDVDGLDVLVEGPSQLPGERVVLGGRLRRCVRSVDTDQCHTGPSVPDHRTPVGDLSNPV